jgi:glutamyl-tRNA synthetase
MASGDPSTTVTRFAPSPTGRLHVGNVRTGLLNWLLARSRGGRFLLRLDDTDRARSTEDFARAIRDDLDLLGLAPDQEFRQSDRDALYTREFERLRAAGRIYPAFETLQELELARKVALGRGRPPIYDRAALRLDEGERTALEAEGRVPHWRFRLDQSAPIEWQDLVRGPQRFDPAMLGDPVVRRADGSWLYLLPSVIDDADMAISHVVRGEDHVTNTAIQLQMFAALGAPVPAFAHVALLTGPEGKLSKRAGEAGLDELRHQGIEPLSLLALLARIGTSDPVEPVYALSELVASFDLSRFGRAPARFDPADLAALNTKMIHRTPFDEVAARLPEGMSELAWNALRGNLTRVEEVHDWWPVIVGHLPVAPADGEDRDFLAAAAEVARAMSWDTDPWHQLTKQLAPTGRRGRALFLPLRRALTGRDHGPDMATLLPLIGRERSIARLKAAAGM